MPEKTESNKSKSMKNKPIKAILTAGILLATFSMSVAAQDAGEDAAEASRRFRASATAPVGNFVKNTDILVNSIKGNRLKDNSVSGAKLIDGSVNGAKLIDGTVNGAKRSNNADCHTDSVSAPTSTTATGPRSSTR